MDKSDVEMEDVIKHPQDLGDGGHQMENDSVDGKIEGDVKDSKLTEVGAEEQIEGKSKEMTDSESAKSEGEVLKIAESEADDPNNVGSEGVKEADDPNNVTREGAKELEDRNNVTSEGVKEVKESNNVTSEGVKELKESNNVTNEGVKEADDLSNVTNEGLKETEDANNVASELKGETNGQHNIKSEAEGQSKIGSGAEGQSKIGSDAEGRSKIGSEACEQDGASHENIVVDQKHSEDAVLEKNPSEQGQLHAELIANEASEKETGAADEVRKSMDESMLDPVHQTNSEVTVIEPKEVENKTTSNGDTEMVEMQETKTDKNVLKERVNVAKEEADNKIVPASVVTGGIAATPVKAKHEIDDHEPATPTALVKCSSAKAGNHSGETHKNVFYELKMPGDEDGTPEEQVAFMKELEGFCRERATEFKPPKFYGQQLNCLKLWRHVIRLGGYDRVTGSKLWRQVGESFHPPKTCTTVSWTFRIFYEKALLEYERYKRDSGELQLPIALPDPAGVDVEGNGFQASGSGRARRDSAARAMQGWHAQRTSGPGEAADPNDKNVNITPKREKNLKSIGSLKQKRPHEVETPVKEARTDTSKQLVASVVDVGSPADWVKINVRETKDSFEVYALVPGLLREEVRVQSDPAGRLVITGTPEQADNPWGISAFKKVVSLPARIDPRLTSAVVSLHGRLFVRVPFEQSN